MTWHKSCCDCILNGMCDRQDSDEAELCKKY